jgi:hypothetical protein
MEEREGEQEEEEGKKEEEKKRKGTKRKKKEEGRKREKKKRRRTNIARNEIDHIIRLNHFLKKFFSLFHFGRRGNNFGFRHDWSLIRYKIKNKQIRANKIEHTNTARTNEKAKPMRNKEKEPETPLQNVSTLLLAILQAICTLHWLVYQVCYLVASLFFFKAC